METSALLLIFVGVLASLQSATAAPSKRSEIVDVYHFQSSQDSDAPVVYHKQTRVAKSVNSIIEKVAIFFGTGLTKLKDVTTGTRRVTRDVFSDLSHGSITCGVCTTIVILAQTLLSSNMSDELIMDSAYNLCTSLTIQTPRVCRGIVNEFA
ncbi:unnamed protein product, partial [Candidula unifasciata]